MCFYGDHLPQSHQSLKVSSAQSEIVSDVFFSRHFLDNRLIDTGRMKLNFGLFYQPLLCLFSCQFAPEKFSSVKYDTVSSMQFISCRICGIPQTFNSFYLILMSVNIRWAAANTELTVRRQIWNI